MSNKQSVNSQIISRSVLLRYSGKLGGSGNIDDLYASLCRVCIHTIYIKLMNCTNTEHETSELGDLEKDEKGWPADSVSSISTVTNRRAALKQSHIC